jgi:gas vesicle structural protein
VTVATQRAGGGGGHVERSGGGGSSGLADVIELILDKGLVIDVFVRVSLVGIEILTIDARIVVASVDTFLRFAEATRACPLDHGTGSRSQILIEATSTVPRNM